MTAFFCDRCDGPIVGNVSENMCTDCLLGVDSEFCAMCGDPMSADGRDGICGDCQEMLDDTDVPMLDLEWDD